MPLDDGYEPDRARANMEELYSKHKVFGVIGNVGHTLGEAKVNIAQFALARDGANGQALALVNVDTRASAEVLEKLRRLPHVLEVRQVFL